MKCKTPRCRNDRAKHKTVCHTCNSRIFRENNPVKAAFFNLRQNAKRRGHVFTITFEDFKKFCRKTKYMAGKGRTKDSFSIDRINPAKGYEPGNLQLLTVSENSSKGKKLLVYDCQTKYAKVI